MRSVLSCIFVLFLAFAMPEGHHLQVPQEGCPSSCFLNFVPVCGRNQNGEYRTFVNKCFFDHYNCRNPDSKYEYVANGACQLHGYGVCPDFCTKEYRPVCGKNRCGGFRTFSNECEMRSFNCENTSSKYMRVQDGDCEPQEEEACPKFCTKKLRPVCAKGKDGELRTFPNECEVESYNCDNPQSEYEVISHERCVEPETTECNSACPDIYRPICARNAFGHHRTFSNECVLEAYNCNNPKLEYVRAYNGRC